MYEPTHEEKQAARRYLYTHAKLSGQVRGWTAAMWLNRIEDIPEAESLEPEEIDAIVALAWT